MRIGIATNAGTYPTIQVKRLLYTFNGVRTTNHEKGGFIDLEWEGDDGLLRPRRIHTSRARALQAMSAIEKKKKVA